MKDKLGAAVIGVGAYGQVHAREYRRDARTQLVSVWSRSKQRREAVSETFGCDAAEDIGQIAEDPRVQIVSIATPDFAHTLQAVTMLEAGKHVLLEKPMAMTTAECKRILTARDRSGRKLMVNYHNRWYPAFAAGREAIRAGTIGKPVCGNFVLSDTISWVEECMKWAQHSGPEWFLMSHIADLAFWMLDDEPVEVSAMAVEGLLHSKGFATRDLVKATMRMQGGAVVHFESSWVLARNWRNPVNEMWLSVQGESGRVDINADCENLTLTADRFHTPFTLLDLTESPPIKDFITSVIEDEPVAVTGEQGLVATQAIEAVVRSYKEHRVVKLEEMQ